MASPLPPRIDRYEVVSRLGRGGMGEVFLGHAPRVPVIVDVAVGTASDAVAR